MDGGGLSSSLSKTLVSIIQMRSLCLLITPPCSARLTGKSSFPSSPEPGCSNLLALSLHRRGFDCMPHSKHFMYVYSLNPHQQNWNTYSIIFKNISGASEMTQKIKTPPSPPLPRSDGLSSIPRIHKVRKRELAPASCPMIIVTYVRGYVCIWSHPRTDTNKR